ncbi:hypothetical protein [Chitinophaga barathri]|uniref:Uncharacterized protein n=1 Tax=Chitinophaga barathri TaxID=1647451 RepID=A0A3N4MFS4_9BACT|nr:hypothetical protein [Chitinophaga barathri]RPD40537.1 hypothetical protein EG028_14625 [Chitinophaga barathri]
MNSTKTKIKALNENVLLDRLRGLDYTTLKTFASEYLDKWNRANEALEQVRAKKPSSYDGFELTDQDITAMADRYFSIHSMCLKVMGELQISLFGRDPFLQLAEIRWNEKFKVAKNS